jgi:hypothetical protein
MPPYRKYTSCVKPSDYVPAPLAVSATAFVAAVAALVGAALLAVAVLVPLLIAVDIALISVCYWYLNGRLVCLGTRFNCQNGNPVPLPDDQECAIGVIGAPGHAGVFRPRVSGLNLTKFGDDDATMNILLAPGPTNYDGADLNNYWNQVQGYLVALNNDVVNAGLGYAGGDDVVYLKHLHCEFEGSGIRDFLDWLLVVLFFLAALLVVLTLAPEATALIVLLSIIAGLLGLGGLIKLFTEADPSAPGDPTDIDPTLGNLQSGDIVMVSGDWIYDSGHAGWNEIHAVHNCQKIAQITSVQNPDGTTTWAWPADIGGGFGLATPDQVSAARANWCCALRAVDGAVKGGSTSDPGNNWVIHPVVDGCKKPVVIV